MKKSFLSMALFSTLSVLAGNNGKLCLTFDDRHFDSWKKAVPFFEKYNAHVTFFVCGNIDEEALASMKILQKAGHSIGLHAVNHTKAADYLKTHGEGAYTKNEIMPQLDICRRNDIKIRSFAYPYSQRNLETDKELFKNFDFLRANCSDVKKSDMPLVSADSCFVQKVGKKQLFYGFPCSGKFNMDEVKSAMKRASEEKAVLVFYAHNITETIPPSHHIAYSQLVPILEYAKSLGMSVCGLNEL